MSNSVELAIREAISCTHGSFLSGLLQSRLLHSGLTGASHPAYDSEGYDLDDIPDSEDIEGLSETTATDDETYGFAYAAAPGPGFRGKHALTFQLDGTPSLAGTEVQGNLISCLPRRPIHVGLGSLGVLPPEIRLQIWEMIIPTIKFCIQPESEQRQRLRRLDLLRIRLPDQPNTESLKTLGILSASKQIYHEIDTHIYHNHSPVSDRSLVIIFTCTRDPSARRVSLERARSSNPGLVLDGTCPSGALPFKNFAAFTSTKLLIELPGTTASFLDFQIVTRSVGNFSYQFSRSQLARRNSRSLPSRSPKIEIVITQMHLEGIRDDIEHDFEFEPSLRCLAQILESFRSFKKSVDATVEVDYDLRYGKEWLPELLSQVANDMQSRGSNRRLQWGQKQWRQKNMEIALAQCHLFTHATRGQKDGGPLPVGLPEALTDDKIQYLSDTDATYDHSDYKIYLDTGELPYRPPGRLVNLDAKFLSWDYIESRIMRISIRTPIRARAKIRALVLRHQRARRNRTSYQSTLLPSESPESSQENHSDSQASKDQVPSSEPREVTSTSGIDQGQPTAQAEDTPALHPWNRYNTSLVPQANATSSTGQAEDTSSIHPWNRYNTSLVPQANLTFPTVQAENTPLIHHWNRYNTSLIPQAAQAESTPVIHPWNRYKTSPVPKAKATSPPQPANSSRPETQPAPATATMSDREFILKGLLIFIVLAVMHRLLP